MSQDDRQTPKPSVRDRADEASPPSRWADWFGRHLAIALAFGVGLGVVGQLLVYLLGRGELDTTVWQRTAAILYGSAVWLVTGFGLALAGWALLRWRLGRVAAVGLSSTTLGLLGILSAMGITLRILSGSYITAGAVLFSFNASEHLWHAAIEGYVGTAALVALVLLIFVVATARLLAPATRVPRAPQRWHMLLTGSLVVLLTLVYVRRADSRFTKGMFVSAPLLALVSSMDSDYELNRSSARPGAIGEPLAPDGPALAEGERWLREAPAAMTARPNVILVMLESMAMSHMSFFGYHRPTTPHLDQLAREGLVMRRTWVTATHSNYSQMAVLSSLFPRRLHGLDMYGRLDYPRFLLHDTFHGLGYDTATISSQDENWQGMRKFQNTGTPTFFWFSDDYTGEHLDSGVERIVPDDDTTDEVLEWLDRDHGSRSWSLYVNLQATHFPYTISKKAPRPYQPDEPTKATFGYLGYPEAEKQVVINRYDNAMVHIDTQVERIRAHLEQKGELDNTLWIITSDHGEMFFDKGQVTHGKTLYDVEARVPLIFNWPGHIQPEQRDEPISHLDVLPTVADLLGVPPHPSWQGRSVRVPHPDSVGHQPIFMNIQGLRTADAIVCWPYKLILERTSGKPYLFDLGRDPEEEVNLISTHEEIAKRLEDTLSKQLIAQLDYHAERAADVRSERYQPRLRGCPKLD